MSPRYTLKQPWTNQEGTLNQSQINPKPALLFIPHSIHMLDFVGNTGRLSLLLVKAPLLALKSSQVLGDSPMFWGYSDSVSYRLIVLAIPSGYQGITIYNGVSIYVWYIYIYVFIYLYLYMYDHVSIYIYYICIYLIISLFIYLFRFIHLWSCICIYIYSENW